MTNIAHGLTTSTAPTLPAVTPQPLPTQFSIHVADGGTARYMLLSMTTPAGTAHYFLDKDAVETLQRSTKAALTQLETGLVLPPTPTL